MKCIWVITIILTFSLAFYSQGKKPVPVKTQVNIKPNPSKRKTKSYEQYFANWFELKSDRLNLKLNFPADKKCLISNSSEKVENIDCVTEVARFGLIVAENKLQFDPKKIKEVYDALQVALVLKGKSKLISFRDVEISDLTGREVLFESGEQKVFGRFVLVENKLYIVSANINKKDYQPDFDKWALKFLDSFEILNARKNNF